MSSITITYVKVMEDMPPRPRERHSFHDSDIVVFLSLSLSLFVFDRCRRDSVSNCLGRRCFSFVFCMFKVVFTVCTFVLRVFVWFALGSVPPRFLSKCLGRRGF